MGVHLGSPLATRILLHHGQPAPPLTRASRSPTSSCGCATAGHQVEGNNINSDLWLIEHLPGSIFKEPSGDACDHYRLYPQDTSMLADLGFNTYRFSLEWSRIEPEEGFFSNSELEHYRRMLATCREHHLTTLLTYSHFSVPRWFAFKGGWQGPTASDLYARFCEKATKHLGDLVGYASTFNEPDIPQLLNWINLPGTQGMSLIESFQTGLARVRQQVNAPEFSDFFLGDGKKIRYGLLAAHHNGNEISPQRHAGRLQPGNVRRPARARGQPSR